MVVVKQHYYSAVAHACMAQHCADTEEWGARISWWRMAAEDLNKCIKAAEKDKTKGMHESLRFARDFIAGSYDIAQKENNFIYHAKVSTGNDLEKLQGKDWY
jgi:hypothetical protein